MKSIILVPWQNDFIHALKNTLVDRDNFSQCTILFPHNRPKRYLKALFKASPSLPRPVFLPKMVSISDFIGGLRRELNTAPIKHPHQLDLVELLYSIVKDLSQNGRGLLARLPEMDRESFLPWGIRLAQLMDDLLRQNKEPEDLTYMDGEVSQYAAALLEQLSAIHREYITRLFNKNWTTTGLDWRFITKHLNDVSTHLEGSPIIAAGFYALSTTEDILFRKLWEDNILTPIIHTDPALATHEPFHWAASEHAAWLKRWKTSAIIPADSPPIDREQKITFCEGFDRHSQLAAMTDDMKQADDLDNSAVVLPDEGALLPVLHHLPEKEPNISMGYPLERTSLARLLETILNLQENKLSNGNYYWRDIINLIRHPYLRLLGPETRPMRKLFHVWEAEIRTGGKYQSTSWEPPYGDEILNGLLPNEVNPLFTSILQCCITRFEHIHSLENLADALSGLAALLHEQGETLWKTYLVDAECLFRLTSSVIPQLKHVEVSKEAYGRSTIFSLLRRILSQERVSFEPEPIGGLQILGVLETRLLHFNRLFILDAVEERLPGTNPYDPLLPDTLRKLLELPDTRERDNVSGYNFYRLLMGADEAIIYYQSGIQPGLLDSKSVRSRFVEQLLWEREKTEKRIIASGDAPVRTITFAASSLKSEAIPIPKSAAVAKALCETLQSRGLSPSWLDKYMQCPKQFYYGYLTQVRPIDNVSEEGDRSQFGSLIHEVLRDFLLPYIGRNMDFSSLDPAPLLNLFESQFKMNEMFINMPIDMKMAMIKTGRHRLATFLTSQETAKVTALEQHIESTLTIDGLTIPVSGYLDRVEERTEGIYILDYKTGNGTIPRKGCWDDMELQDRISDFLSPEKDPDLLIDLANSIKSVQLPFYMYLMHKEQNVMPYDAGLIKLGDGGKTELLFGKKWTDEERTEVVGTMTPRLITTIVRHMVVAPDFTPQPGRICQWCDYKTPCGQ